VYSLVETSPSLASAFVVPAPSPKWELAKAKIKTGWRPAAARCDAAGRLRQRSPFLPSYFCFATRYHFVPWLRTAAHQHRWIAAPFDHHPVKETDEPFACLLSQKMKIRRIEPTHAVLMRKRAWRLP